MENEVTRRSEESGTRSALRRADRLDRYRVDEAGFQAAFIRAIKKWLEGEPKRAEEFMTHMRNATAAASTTVLAIDFTSWFPSLPLFVQLPLNDLARFYHAEAYLTVHLREMENHVMGWSKMEDLHPEIIHAVQDLRADNQAAFPGDRQLLKVKIERFALCGLHLHENCIAEGNFDILEHPAQAKLTARQVLLRIQANFELRKVILTTDTNLGFLVVQWTRAALDFLKAFYTQEKVDAASGNLLLFEKVFEEIESWNLMNKAEAYRLARRPLIE